MFKGFTLIELMITIAIIGIVFGVVITSSGAIQKSSRDTTRQANLKTIQAALEQYHADEGYYPDSITFGSALLGITPPPKTYLNPIPTDPLNTGTNKYSYAPSNGGAACSGDCTMYCLYAQLEASTGTSFAPSCIAVGNYSVSQP